ncbi:hypothetical protein KL918_004420 [Ogataea parapolymorpha]|uniref:Subunit of a heterodimeric peroxisomal ATP-binding cassette transporter complex (Pxa1p-Pxa2p) n=1 Tax=Ogataea parapolymorpha (strain ATCC 26012 / BCRC 20466 / JCM 22074 / NRRL Y-7560 / DL-1) TaxID=871575 RepID=W1QFE4_OGAPD|nr:Subunit of a heterodimeric peroxisomal ATP-binding cassette transporter complex (Pxa1p-Pxa2p) [Ogataea parapolymorpha DL-1]ESX00802.1 Subunit of a heterodimeric peroxisomal ATP-binding cassette transporter complex (Pxa1p-Pxa2p) [Ogataea parapolymorpha DL-1]KAG7865539.1 hypothetical protein KL918_004420 [Ogataea parapolymorpha]KAG7873588.1 hypothetical protein KL916_002192 [Ogataea parapolymorpha]KAG7879682.1 hypothetical protein KL938_003735 [Ogataea parapolymorpha]
MSLDITKASVKQSLSRLLWNNSRALKFLNISLNSKPVLLFLLSISSSSIFMLIYNVVKLINYFKLKSLQRSQLDLSKRNFYKKGSDYRIINVPYKNNNLKVKIDRTNPDKYEHDKLVFKKFLRDTEFSDMTDSVVESKFLKKLYIIWRHVLIPKVLHPNSTILVGQLLCLVARTWMSLLVTRLDGQIVKDLIGLRGKAFLRGIIYWFLFAFPASYINSGIKFLTHRLALNFRTNLVRYCHDLYMDPRMVYYKLQFNQNQSDVYKMDFNYVDQYLTEDIKKFSDSLTSMFLNVGKPTVDLIFFAIYLRDNIGSAGISGILMCYFLTGWFLKRHSPNFSKIWKTKTHLEGIYYNYNLNLINNCEEISFYKGIKIEKSKVHKIFNNLLSHSNLEINAKFHYGLLEEYILRYAWPAFGYFFSSFPILLNYNSADSDSIKGFIVNKRLMLNMADAGSRLMYSIKDISSLSGVTDRIFTLLLNLHQVHDHNFQYGIAYNGFGSQLKLTSFTSRLRVPSSSHIGINGTIQTSYPGLRFEHIPVIVPSAEGINGTKLLSSLNFKINLGETLLILGKNGIGKTSIMRIISELWPLYRGLLSKPAPNEIMYVSQKSYFINGSLRDQIIYPLNHLQMIEKGYTDHQLITYLNEVGLGYLLERFGNLDYHPNETATIMTDELIVNGKSVKIYNSNVGLGDGKKSWHTLLSGGERQKLIMARVLFHQKKFVILDEPTNAISYDYEDAIFEMMKAKKFTFITISHRETLIKYHDYVLRLNDVDNYEFERVDDGLKTFESMDKEIAFLKAELEQMDKAIERKQELLNLLSGPED